MWMRLNVLKQEKGQGMVEYAIIIALVAVVAIGAFLLLGNAVSTSIGSSTSSF
jgi:pilus assembly protein Flp/PilA